MRNSQSQLRLVPGNPGPSTKQTDTSGNPSETYHWAQLAAVRQEWQHQFRYPYVNMLQPSAIEIRTVERWVREELYPLAVCDQR
jgi:disulfide oxidoreductase YuzD